MKKFWIKDLEKQTQTSDVLVGKEALLNRYLCNIDKGDNNYPHSVQHITYQSVSSVYAHMHMHVHACLWMHACACIGCVCMLFLN